ncbi:MAG: galactokinase [Myxococcota bacterium]|nr:galactokinase [Myxococcota bacterium]
MIASRQDLERFKQEFGRTPLSAGRAPGRVNLIGEHTDYNQGLVLPCAINRSTLSLVSPRDDDRVRIQAWDLGEEWDLPLRGQEPGGGSSDYVLGVLSALAEKAVDVPGFDLAITSSVPMGSGLSSSAALSVSLVAALDGLLGLGLSKRNWAELAHRAESHYVGVGCGVLDPLASALGQKGAALRIDCRHSEVEPIEIEGDAWSILIFHSGVTRRLLDGSYTQRVAECEQALEAARAAGVADPDATSLSDLSVESIAELASVLPDKALRRARHVVTENQRVEAFCLALRQADHAALGELLIQGQASLRDDYEVSILELDSLCELANRCEGVFGSRLTGAGGGGCTLHLVQPDCVAAVQEEVASQFAKRFGYRPDSWVVLPAEGARAVRQPG